MGLEKNCMLTGNGHLINLLDSKEEQIYLEDISSSLSKICRYSGGTIRFYSVAQHCLNCCKLARMKYDSRTGLYLLLHDAAETYISDIPTPVKKLIPNIDMIEKGINTAIYHKFGLEYPSGIYLNRINEMDSNMLANEIPVLVPKLECIIPKGTVCCSEILDFTERSFDEVKQEFENEVKYLVKRIKIEEEIYEKSI